jgi:S-adenosylmethionine:tRNA ribosyltransferase-isomerase
MKPATEPRSVRQMRILVVDPASGARQTWPASALPELLRSGDLVVVNDAATLPASLFATTESGAAIELRLVGAIEPQGDRVRFRAALLGSGDYRTRTEDRAAPERVSVGDTLSLAEGLVARVLGVSSFSERLLDLELALARAPAHAPAHAHDDIWAALYRAGRPVQYAHVPRPLALWDVQNVWAARPWAVEMPSAGRLLRIDTLVALRRRGVEIVSITHAAGLSATGDPAIDARLPLPERFEVGEAAARAVLRTRARGGRVIAVGTSVVRALESAARVSEDGVFRAASGTTALLLGPDERRLMVDGVITGVHESETTHFTLLRAFTDRATLDSALAAAERDGLLGHELGDAWLVWGDSRGVATAAVAPRERVDVPVQCASSAFASSATFAA